MLETFTTFVNARKLFAPQSKVLLAVSGGLDSVVMTHLFHAAQYPFAIAHCNFQLRGADADGDADFVEELARSYGVSFFCRKFDTEHFAAEQGISIQMAARRLRYDWFEELATYNHFSHIATGHHADDHMETLLIHMARGTGVKGLTGIPVANGRLVRPLLFASRAELEDYAHSQKLQFREDISNADDKYTRNKIRHHVVPVLKEINPALHRAARGLSDIAADWQQLINFLLNDKMAKLIRHEEGQVVIPTSPLLQMPCIDTLLHELLSPYNFQPPVISDLARSLNAQPGKVFYSHSHRCILDREQLILAPLEEHQPVFVEIEKTDSFIAIPGGHLLMTLEKNEDDYPFPKQPTVACLDAEKIKYPLVLRQVKHGDWFCPFGMKGKKKINHFLTDAKVPVHQKQNQLVLCNASGEILWLIGRRSDNRYRISPKTRKILKVIYEKVSGLKS